MEPVSRFKRFLAYCVDGLICSVGVILVMVCVTVFSISGYVDPDLDKHPVYLIAVAVVVNLVVMLYYALFESSKNRATPGKMLFKMCVSTNAGDKLTFLWACYRYFISAFPSIVSLLYKNIATTIEAALVLICFLPIYFTKNRLCLHDIITRTRVVKKVIKK